MCIFQDDSPRENLKAADLVPIKLHIDILWIERNDDGTFLIRGLYVPVP